MCAQKEPAIASQPNYYYINKEVFQLKKRHYIAILVLINLLVVIGILVGCVSRSNDTSSNNQPKQLEFSGEDFRSLYPSWTLLEKELVTLDKDTYAIIVSGQVK